MELTVKKGSATLNIVLGAVTLGLLLVLVVINAMMGGGIVIGGAIPVALLVGGILGLVIGFARNKWSDTPVATIDGKGITPHPLDCGTIPWSSVRKAEVKQLLFAKQLVVETTHPMNRAPVGVSLGIGMAVVNKKDHNRFSLGLGPMDKKPDEVQAALAQYRPQN